MTLSDSHIISHMEPRELWNMAKSWVVLISSPPLAHKGKRTPLARNTTGCSDMICTLQFLPSFVWLDGTRTTEYMDWIVFLIDHLWLRKAFSNFYWHQWLSVTFSDFQWLSVNFSDFQWLSVTFSGFQWLSVTFSDFSVTFQWLSSTYSDLWSSSCNNKFAWR